MDARQRLRKDLVELASEGQALSFLEWVRTLDEEAPVSDDTRKKFDRFRKKWGDLQLRMNYQGWYTRALPVVRQLLPDRAQEFEEQYRWKAPPKQLDTTTFTISDFLGHVLPYSWSATDATRRALVRFGIQVDILSSALGRLDSLLADITGTLEGLLFDDELATARALWKEKLVRPAGVVAGVVLERHLKRLLVNHSVKVPGKGTPKLSAINHALKEAGVYDLNVSKRIEWLAHVRNDCAHPGEKEPTREDVEKLLDHTAELVKTLI